MSFLLRNGRAVACVAAPLVLALAAGWVWQSNQVSYAAERQEETPSAERIVSGPVSIAVNSALTASEPPGSAIEVCGVSEEAAGLLGPPLSGTRLKAQTSSDLVPVYAASTQHGLAVMVANRSDAAVEVRLGFTAPRGVWGVQRWTAPATGDAGPVRIDRLQSVLHGTTGVMRKYGSLAPGETAVYRLVNYSVRTSALFRNVQARVRAIRSEEGAEYRRLMTPLNECGAQIARLSKGIRPSTRTALLKHVHRALLTVAHAQALSRNARRQGRIADAQDAASIESGLDHLEESLTELSAASLGLTPNVRLTPAEGACKLTISLANGGSQTLEVAKLGLTVPRGVRVKPALEAPFRALQPGQSVHADFTVYVAPGTADPAVIADVSYRTARAPAHLRLRRVASTLKAADVP